MSYIDSLIEWMIETENPNEDKAYWRGLREDFIDAYPRCFVCGGTKNLDVHHVLPRHKYPELQYEWDNLVTLCRKSEKIKINCHYLFGHGGKSWDNYNPKLLDQLSTLRDIFWEK